MQQASENILVRDGHVEAADLYENIDGLEAFMSSNRAESVRLDNDVDLTKIQSQISNFAKNMDIEVFSLRTDHLFQINMFMHCNADLMQ